MKKLLLLLFVCFACGYANAQGCTAPFFTTQQQLDNFKIQNPTCDAIYGDLFIYGSGITNLDGLSNITVINGSVKIDNTNLLNLHGLDSLISIEGRLTIIDNALLTDLDGLEKLVSLSDGINIESNPALTALSGLQSLSHVGSYLRVVYNSALISIEAFNKITVVTGFLSVGGNSELESLSGLHNISSAPSVSIGSNAKLLSLDGLKSLNATTGYLYVGDNSSITDLQGLNNLRTVAGYLNIDGNGELTTLKGMDALESSNYIRIQNNAKLSMCAAGRICKAVRQSPDYARISSNAPGCNTPAEVLAMCISLPVELVSFSAENTVDGNVLKWITASEINNKGFEVERSLNGRSFETIGFVEGNTESKQALNYSFTDPVAQALTYYRLKQIDWDGTSTYSRIVSVKKKNAEVKVYPNPARGLLFIDTQDPKQPYVIKNSQGITVKASATIPQNGISTTNLQSGIYFITVGSEVFKVLVNNE